ncbi:LpxI family protein [Candidatus Omnitrophota bacterium]
MERIGLVAGGGDLPIIFAREARKKGAKVIGFAIKGMAKPEFDGVCDRAHRVGFAEIPKFIFLLAAERIRKIALLGKIDKSVIYTQVKKGKKGRDIVDKSKDKSDYSILEKVTSEFEKRGIEVINGVEYLAALFPQRGVLTERRPSEQEVVDVEIGLRIAKEVARLDIGQTIIVKDKAVVSVEAMEGTDRTIERAAGICGAGFVVVKVSRPAQDMRWDVPTVGPDTVKCIVENKGKVLALEEKKMFLVDKEACVNLANQNDISIVVA